MNVAENEEIHAVIAALYQTKSEAIKISLLFDLCKEPIQKQKYLHESYRKMYAFNSSLNCLKKLKSYGIYGSNPDSLPDILVYEDLCY